jgi:uncharacterized protein
VDLDVVGYVVLVLVGVLAGAMNTIAGGGSLTTVPVLLLLGLPPAVANATNRLAIVAGALTSTVGFARAGAIDRRALVPVIATSAVGALGGALLATAVPERALEIVLLAAMIGMAALLVVRPTLVVAPDDGEPRWSDRRAAALVGLVGCGLYGGFVQAGVGLLLVGVLSGTLGYPVARANGLKAVATLVFGAVALAVFAADGLVAWLPATVLAAASVVGALIGVRLALVLPGSIMRWTLFVCVVATSVAALAR